MLLPLSPGKFTYKIDLSIIESYELYTESGDDLQNDLNGINFIFVVPFLKSQKH